MQGFVKITTLFESNSLRTVEILATKYDNFKELKVTIYDLISNELIDTGMLHSKSILLKPNWVLQNRKPDDEICLRTHMNFILAVLEVILEAAPAKVTIGDAPVQGCNWNRCSRLLSMTL